MAPKKIEDGIRSYLDSLGASTKPVVDKEAVKALKADIRTATDPIAKLRLLAALETEEAGHAVDHAGEQAVFVAEAKAWADAEGIPVSAFQALKVPDAVLREAGFTLSASGAKAATTRAPGARATSIPLETVQATASKLGASWKLTDLAAALDREPATVRNYVTKLIADAVVKEVGEDPSHDGRGRAAKVYSLR